MKKFWYYFDLFILVLLVFSLIFSVGVFMHQETRDGFSLIVNLIALVPVLISTFKALKNRKITVDLLASIALLLSLINHEYFSSLFINLMLTTARIVDSYTERKTEDSIKSLLKLKPEKARIKTKNGVEEVKINDIKIGDIVLVGLGQRVPVDGKILNGSASLDQSSLTGESLPVEKKEGEEVLSSTLVTSGELEIEAVRVGKDTALEKIIQLVSDSQLNKPEITMRSDRFAQWYIILTFIVTIVLYIITNNLNLVLSVILVVCADDIAVAVPLAFIGGTRAASRLGIIIKGGKYLEAIGEVKTLIVDKTGTLTRGKLKVNEIFTLEKKSEILKVIFSIVQGSIHPVSEAIEEFLMSEKIKSVKHEELKEFKGLGISVVYKGEKYFFGRRQFILDQVKKINKNYEEFIMNAEEKGFNASILSNSKEVLAVVTLSDRLKPDTKKVISELREEGIERIIMLTGDNEKVAKTIAEETGIQEYHANLLPEDKIKYLKSFLNKDSKTAMIGDGVNDAASLSLADVGIAMGGIGSDAAIDSADIILVNDQLTKVKEVIDLSKFILNIAKQDYIIWVLVNILGLSLVFGGVLTPSGAAFYNFITDFIPLINSMRAFFWKRKK
ncbi:MAG: cation-translocating P-type ATPase [Candidatus Dojkabacteria bacterium]